MQLPDFSQNLSIKIGLLENNYNDANISIDSATYQHHLENEIENLNIVPNHGSEDVITNAHLFINNQKSTHSVEILNLQLLKLSIMSIQLTQPILMEKL